MTHLSDREMWAIMIAAALFLVYLLIVVRMYDPMIRQR